MEWRPTEVTVAFKCAFTFYKQPSSIYWLSPGAKSCRRWDPLLRGFYILKHSPLCIKTHRHKCDLKTHDMFSSNLPCFMLQYDLQMGNILPYCDNTVNWNHTSNCIWSKLAKTNSGSGNTALPAVATHRTPTVEAHQISTDTGNPCFLHQTRPALPLLVTTWPDVAASDHLLLCDKQPKPLSKLSI